MNLWINSIMLGVLFILSGCVSAPLVQKQNQHMTTQKKPESKKSLEPPFFPTTAVIPDPPSGAPAMLTTEKVPLGNLYVVKKGDTMWSICSTFLKEKKLLELPPKNEKLPKKSKELIIHCTKRVKSLNQEELDNRLKADSRSIDQDGRVVNQADSIPADELKRGDLLCLEPPCPIPGYDPVARQAFAMLASDHPVGGVRIIHGPRGIVKEVKSIILSLQSDHDIVLLIDKTGSMADDIQSVIAGANDLLEAVQKQKGVRLTIASYGDLNVDGPTWYEHLNFSDSDESVKNFLINIYPGGGGDWPESVYEAVMLTIQKSTWRQSSKRMIILVGDAPPLTGALAQYTEEQVRQGCKEAKVHVLGLLISVQ